MARLLLVLAFLVTMPVVASERLTYETIVGPIEITDPLAIELIESPAMQRLKGIDQHGIVHYTCNTPPYSRFTHSVGVYALLVKFGASRAEQIAGLLHDASHTVFSHVGDVLYGHQDAEQSYQDTIHEWYLKEQGVDRILDQYGYTIEDILPDRPEFTLLERSLPDICADRLEYNLHTCLLFDLVSEEDVKHILGDLTVVDGQWCFRSAHWARRLALGSLFFTQNFWGSPWNRVSYHWVASALKQLMELGLLTPHMVHFGEDYEVVELLAKCDDTLVLEHWQLTENVRDTFVLSHHEDHDLFEAPKFRGLNPLVIRDGQTVRLTTIDPWFKQMYLHVQETCKQGWHFKWDAA